MPQTRAQKHAEETEQNEPPKNTKGRNKSQDETSHNEEVRNEDSSVPQKRKTPPPATPQQDPSPKKAKAEEGDNSKAQKVLDNLLAEHASFPLQDVNLTDPKSATAETVLAHIYNAILSSSRISHNLAQRALKTLIDAGYADFATLKSSTWNDRCDVLTEGGYARYREKTATELEELAKLLENKYEGDASKLLANLPDDVQEAQKVAMDRIKEIKGIGPLGAELFVSTAQGICATLAPFLDSRSVKAVEEIDIGTVRDIFEMVGGGHQRMSEVAQAVTAARLAGEVADIKES